MTIGTPGSITAVMDALVAVEQTIQHPDLPTVTTYRWEPLSFPAVPAVWNWWLESPAEKRAIDQLTDEITIAVRCGVRHTDSDGDMRQLEVLADVARDVLDRSLNMRGGPFDGTGNAVTRGWRQSARMIQVNFNQTPCLCIEFPIRCELWRDDVPN